MADVQRVQAGSRNRILLQWTTLAHPIFTSENALQNKNVPLIATCLSLSLYKSCPESGEKHTCTHAHYELLHNLNRSKIHPFPYIFLFLSLSLQIFLIHRPIGLKKGTANRCLSTGHANVCAKKPAGETWPEGRGEARSNDRGQRQERDDEIISRSPIW